MSRHPKEAHMVEWTVCCTEEQVESLCDALEAMQCLSASVEDADAQTEAERALFGEPGMPASAAAWQRSKVRALFADATVAGIARASLSERAAAEAWQDLGVSSVPDHDWVRLTQSQFSPVHIANGFWIVPSWHEAPADARTVMQLDPGLAFGTGSHPTTRMCLQWLAGPQFSGLLISENNLRVLDYGCGSGVLAIAAGLLARSAQVGVSIDAVDLDAAAILATTENARANDVSLNAGEVTLASGQYDVVLANILATPLKVLAPLLCARMAAGGHLVLAGILERQAEELQEAYSPWVDLKVSNSQDGWILMTARHRAQ
jgi:ribosomal protein L11 methyltransferase